MPPRRPGVEGRGALRGASELIRLPPVRFACRSSRRGAGAGAASALVLLAAIGGGCAGYSQDVGATKAIYDVRVTTNAKDVAECRLIEHVDSRDTAKGCGLTVQPTPEECLRYQVRRAGGDTLLERGPAGEAYDCSGRAAAPHDAVAPGAPPALTPASRPPAATLAPTLTPTPVPIPPVPAAPVSVSSPTPSPRPAPAIRVRITGDREAAKGCVYLGDAAAACAEASGEASGDCADQALKAGGDLVLWDGARAQIFSCKAKP
jgi:hypothetical protein